MVYTARTIIGTTYEAMDLDDARRRWPLPPLAEYHVYIQLVYNYDVLIYSRGWDEFAIDHRAIWQAMVNRAQQERDFFANGYPEAEYEFLMERENANRAEAADVRAGCPYIVDGRCTLHGENCGWLPDYVSMGSSSEEEGDAVPTRCLVL